MAGYVCPCCGEISDTFGRGGGETMAEQNGVDFLGRVPIDTVLVGLLDAVSKGEVEATGLSSANGTAESRASAIIEDRPFPLLERYLATTSSKVWKGIAMGIVDRIETRRSKISTDFRTDGST